MHNKSHWAAHACNEPASRRATFPGLGDGVLMHPHPALWPSHSGTIAAGTSGSPEDMPESRANMYNHMSFAQVKLRVV
jgi:hypothetical protein